MIIYIFTAILVTLLGAMTKKEIASGEFTRQRGLNYVSIAAVFTVLTLLAALRLEVGNDYGNYVVTCHEIYMKGYVVTEPGFNLVVRLLYNLSGKEDYILMFAVFGAAIVGFFLKAIWDLSDSFGLSLFLFMTLGIYFMSFNTVRYYLALSMAMYGIKYVIGIFEPRSVENIFKFVLLIAIAATFHKSVLAVIPMYMLAALPWRKWMYGLLAVGGGLVFICREQIMDIALRLYPSYANTVYIEETHTIMENKVAIIRSLLVIALFLYCRQSGEDKGNRFYVKLSVMSLVLYVCGYYLPLVTRFGYYLITPQIILIPGILGMTEGKKRKYLYLAVAVLGILCFAAFLSTADEMGVRVLPYKSWLFMSRRWLNQSDTF